MGTRYFKDFRLYSNISFSTNVRTVNQNVVSIALLTLLTYVSQTQRLKGLSGIF